MNILILRAKYTENINGLPDEWPVEAQPYKEGDPVPENWEKCTKTEFENIREQLRESYDVWERSHRKKEAKEKERTEAEERNKQLACRRKLLELGFEEEEVKILMSKNYPN